MAENATSTPSQQASESTLSTLTAVGPNNTPITLQYINDNAWTKEFKLDLKLNNWDEWSFQITLLAGRQGFSKILNGSFTQPSVDTHSKAHHIWASNDESLKHFLYSHISWTDYRNIAHLPTANAIFEELCKIY